MTTLYHFNQSSSIPTASGIYRITCASNGRFYIGSSINLSHRFQEHRGRLRHTKHENIKLQRAWDKYGEEAFSFEVLELVLFPELLTNREQYWFDKLKPFGNRGFNIVLTAGSNSGMKLSPEHREKLRVMNLGRKHTEEAKRRMAKSQKGKKHKPSTIHKMHLARLGHVISPEGRARISIANTGRPSINKGKKASLELRKQLEDAHVFQRKTIVAISPDGTEYIAHGVRSFCKEHSLDHSALTRVAQGRQDNHKGWKARYPESDTI